MRQQWPEEPPGPYGVELLWHLHGQGHTVRWRNPAAACDDAEQ